MNESKEVLPCPFPPVFTGEGLGEGAGHSDVTNLVALLQKLTSLQQGIPEAGVMINHTPNTGTYRNVCAKKHILVWILPDQT